MKKLIVIIGTTAIGKTALSIKLAQHYNCDIISSDSRQFFKEMKIGTAVPTTKELNSANHHFIQHISINDNYSVGKFEKQAILKIDELHQNNDFVVMVGGSGLYTNAILYGLDDFPEIDVSIRTKLNKRLIDEGIESLQNQLKKLDIKAYNSIKIDNPQRLTRALEVCLQTGKTYSSFLNQPNKKRNFKPIIIGLEAEREIIYDRINRRVDLMIENGLIDEAKSLIKHKNLNALNTVGYKELFNYFDNNFTLEEAISEIKKNTRRFAKRQITWNKKYDSANWFNYKAAVKNIIKKIDELS